MKFGDEFFKKVEKKTNVSKDTILSLAEKLQKGNMKDEKTLSEVIDTLSKMTGKKVSDEQNLKLSKKWWKIKFLIMLKKCFNSIFWLSFSFVYYIIATWKW